MPSPLFACDPCFLRGCGSEWPPLQWIWFSNWPAAVFDLNSFDRLFSLPDPFCPAGALITPYVPSPVQLVAAVAARRSGHADANLPNDDRAELSDYVRSGFDRGHMAPNGDMPTRSGQYESFTLANMVLQNPNNNRYIWERK